MPTRTARTIWNGGLNDGKGTVTLASSGVGSYEVNFPKRAADDADGTTSPEELIAAAHSTCFSMALSHGLAGDGHAPQEVDTRAEVDFVPGTGITEIRLTVRAKVDGISNDEFVAAAENARVNCPVSLALTGTTIKVDAALK